MSEENVEVVHRTLGRFTDTQQLSERIAPDWVWDMGTFRGWPGRVSFAGATRFSISFGADSSHTTTGQRTQLYATAEEALEAPGLSE